jgi:hypothetical protein
MMSNDIVPFKPSQEVQNLFAKFAAEEYLGSGGNDFADKIVSLDSRCYQLRDTDHSTLLRKRIEEAEKLIAELAPYRQQIIAACQPATVKEIRLCVGTLVACFPTHNRDDAFGQILAAKIAAANPSIGGVDATCCHLIRTQKKGLPFISEVLDVLEQVEGRLGKFAGLFLRDMPKAIEQAKAQLPQLEQREAEKRQAWEADRENRILNYIDRLDAGEKYIRWQYRFEEDEIDEAKRRRAARDRGG